ncbi:MAG: cupin [Erythrobacter sp.]|nr:cupin [Erythrobacter sp.]
MSAGRLDTQFIHLGLGATADTLPPFTGMEWYEAYSARAAADGAEGRLVSQYTFTESWTAWELHPAGAEVVICTDGAMVLIQESPGGGQTEIALAAGDYAINPPGVWHTADVAESATAIFITAGEGTTHRPR